MRHLILLTALVLTTSLTAQSSVRYHVGFDLRAHRFEHREMPAIELLGYLPAVTYLPTIGGGIEIDVTNRFCIRANFRSGVKRVDFERTSIIAGGTRLREVSSLHFLSVEGHLHTSSRRENWAVKPLLGMFVSGDGLFDTSASSNIGGVGGSNSGSTDVSLDYEQFMTIYYAGVSAGCVYPFEIRGVRLEGVTLFDCSPFRRSNTALDYSVNTFPQRLEGRYWQLSLGFNIRLPATRGRSGS